MLHNWALSENKVPIYWFGDRVFNRQIGKEGIIYGMRWSNNKEPHHWLYIVKYSSFRKQKGYLAKEENLEPR